MVFSPHGGGKNEIWNVFSPHIPDPWGEKTEFFSLHISDPWGEKHFIFPPPWGEKSSPQAKILRNVTSKVLKSLYENAFPKGKQAEEQKKFPPAAGSQWWGKIEF